MTPTSWSFSLILRPFRWLVAWLASFKFDGSDALALLGLSSLTAGLWLVSPALALAVLGSLLLVAWTFRAVVLPLLVLRRG